MKTSGGVGPQPVIAGGVELLIVIPTGKLSLTAKFVRSVSLGAKISILNRALPPMTILEGENDFIPVTSVLVTVTVAFAGRRLPTPWSVVKAPAGIVFVKAPAAVPAGAVT